MIEPKEKINLLIRQLNKWNHEYYVDNAPTVSDYEYDQCLKELVELENQFPELQQPNSPTRVVGGKVASAFKKYQHETKMLSLGNVFNIEEFTNFNKQVQATIAKPIYYAEIKMDGLALSLIYEFGKLTTGVTRGDGVTGEDISSNVLVMHTIPAFVNEWQDLAKVEVRGEVFFYKHIFKKINEQRKLNEDELFKNPRNAVAGTMRQLDSAIVGKRQPSFMAYGLDVNTTTTLGINEISKSMEYLKSIGFLASLESTVGSLTEIWNYCKNIEKNKNNFPFEIDGVVIKVNDISKHETIGYTSKAPKWATAYKFKATEVETRILNVTYQVGRTGTITPVAELDPVTIDGSLVSRATLNNKDMIELKDLHYGDYVLIRKAGEIIPEVIEAIVEKRKPDAQKIIFISNCPSCDSPLVEDPGAVAIRCVNPNCNAKKVNKLIHFVSRNALNIDGFGAKVVEKFYDWKLIDDFTSIFKLQQHAEFIKSQEGFGDKSVDKLLENIEKAKGESLSKFLIGFGIRHIGQRSATVLAQQFKTIDKILECESYQLEELYDFGPEMVKSIIEWKTDQDNIDMINNLKELGVQFIEETEVSFELQDLTFVITGKLQQYKRDELKQILESKGAKVASAISKNTDYLVAGEKAGSKLTKAQELGVKIISEKEIKDYI